MSSPPRHLAGSLRALRPALWFCAPTLVGTVIFLFSFPLYRKIPFTEITIFDALFVWALAAPFFTVAAMVTLARRSFRQVTSRRFKICSWLGLILLALWNALLVAGFWAAAYV